MFTGKINSYYCGIIKKKHNTLDSLDQTKLD